MRLDQTGPREPRPGNWVRRIRLEQWAWLTSKIIGVAWVMALLSYTPKALYDAIGLVIFLIAAVTVLGGLVSVVGLVMSEQTGKTALLGLSVELSGLFLLMAGPLSYFGIQLYLASQPEGDQRYALVVYSLWVIAMLSCRIVRVATRRWVEAHDPAKDM